jgi:diguanylate cyclase (GGDEF)-like protein
VADDAAWLLVSDEAAEGEAFEVCRDAAAHHLDLDDEEFEQALVEAGPSVAEIAAMFEMDPLSDVPVTELLVRAKQSLTKESMDVVAALSVERQRVNELSSENVRLSSEASTDALTGLPNRRSFDRYLDDEVAVRLRGSRSGSLGLMIFDIDLFKSINDAHGHLVGDEVLRGIAARLEMITRRGEPVARVGGEEFAVILPTTNPDEIVVAAERLRAGIAEAPFDTASGPLDVTVSVGAVCTPVVTEGISDRLYVAADTALYAAKAAGRNRAHVAETV